MDKKIPNIEEEILRLKKEKNAVILAHYYQNSDIQDIADFVGDSLDLSRKSNEANADVIVFCGVHFMAETAKILSPKATVLLPDLDAGCSLADACPANEFENFIKENPDHIVISYINCTAEVKALSDVICTSSNAVKIVNSFPKSQKIIFAPDKNLGKYVMKQTGRNMVLWNGSCIVHEMFSESKIRALKAMHPTAEIISHPECEEIILSFSDFIGSTKALINYAKTSRKTTFIVATESGILHQMGKACPEKTFIPAPPNNNCACNDCEFMKKNTMQKLYNALKNNSPQIQMKEETRIKAKKSLDRMLELSK